MLEYVKNLIINLLKNSFTFLYNLLIQNYKIVIITILSILIIYFSYNVVSGLFEDIEDKPVSVIIDDANLVNSTDEDIKTLIYVQTWLNYWHPYVLNECVKQETPVKQCNKQYSDPCIHKKYVIKKLCEWVTK